MITTLSAACHTAAQMNWPTAVAICGGAIGAGFALFALFKYGLGG
jgi:hypothetical protein